MSKPRNKQPKDVRPFWMERGFRPDFAAMQLSVDDDPRGEAAYQRAFYDAAQSKPPRLPNPSHFPNSPSAREYMRKRSMDFLGGRTEKRNGDDNPDALRAIRRQRDPDMTADEVDMKSSSTSPASSYSVTANGNAGVRNTLPSFISTPRAEDANTLQFTAPRQLPPLPSKGAPLTTLEPSAYQTAPQGPSNKLRPYF